jgi:hypothetical protein
MLLDITGKKAEFLKLAIKVISGNPTQDDRDQMTRLMTKTPSLRVEFDEIKKQLKGAQDEDFMQLYLRCLFNKASSEESAQLRSLKDTNPAKWNEFQQIVFSLQALGDQLKTSSIDKSAPEPMPEKVRSRLLTELKARHKPN